MSQSNEKCRERYVYHPKDRSKRTCLIHGPSNSSDECKVLGDFGSKYAKSRTTKDRGHGRVDKIKSKSQQEINSVVNSAFDETLLQENQTVIPEKVAPENIESDFDENELSQIENIILDDTK